MPSGASRFLVPLDQMMDDVALSRRGYYFIQRASNGLQGGFTWMVSRITQLADLERL